MPIVAAACMPHPPIILPAVGKGEEAKIQKTAAACLAAARFLAAAKPDAIVLPSPHATLYADYFHISPGAGAAGGMARFGAPGLQLRTGYDEALAAAIAREAEAAGLPAGFEGEREPQLDHGTLIPLWFLQQALPGVPIVRIGLSALSQPQHYALGQCIAAAAGATGKAVAVLASGDLSHRLREDGPYGFAPEGPRLDGLITAALASASFGELLAIPPALAEKGAECGLRALVIMAGALDGRAVQANLLSYEDTFGVGYAVATFAPGAPQPGRRFASQFEAAEAEGLAARRRGEDAYVRLARQSLEGYVRSGRRAPLPEGLPEELTGRRAGVFVSLHKYGELRGCIGTIAPVTPSIAQEIWRNAVAAAAEDPRFAPVQPEELPLLEVKVDVLGESEPIASAAQLDVKRYGVIVSSGRRRGLLLPDLDGVDTPAQQVDIARQKAGIPEGEPLTLERFEVVRHQ